VSEEEQAFDLELEKEYKRLIVEYAESLPAKANDLIKSVESCFQHMESESGKKTLENASKLAHKLAGSAGSYTFHDLGEQLQKLNLTLSSIAKDCNSARLSQERLRIKEMLGQIEKLAYDAAAKSH
jgi:hypothetical protein